MITKALAQGLELVGVEPAIGDDDTIELDSLQVVTLVEHLEHELGIMFDGDDVTRENFSSRKALAALLSRKVKGASS
jgi:acyl carrier protein